MVVVVVTVVGLSSGYNVSAWNYIRRRVEDEVMYCVASSFILCYYYYYFRLHLLFSSS